MTRISLLDAVALFFLAVIMALSVVLMAADSGLVGKFVGGLSLGFWGGQAFVLVRFLVQARREKVEAERERIVRDVMES